MFICEDKEGNEILQAMENPAHDEWKTANWEKKGTTIGRPALSALRDFISRSVESVFSSGSGDQLHISGLEKYLYTPSDLSETASNDDAENPFSGNPTGNYTNEGTSLTTDTEEQTQQAEENNVNNNGQATVVVQGDATPNDTATEEAAAGAGNHKSKRKGGKKHATRSSQTSDIAPSDDENYRTIIDVNYRQIAQKEEGQYVHYLKISSPLEVTQGEIVFVLDGDDTYEVAISECDNGNVKSGEILTLENIKLSIGVNTIRVKFGDSSRKHGIRLEAYQITSKK